MNFGIAEIRELTDAMSKYPDMDYRGYVLSFLTRRLSFVFDQLKIRKKEKFIEELNDTQFRDKVKSLMCVEATEMFRDPSFWRTLRDKILKQISSENNTIWFPKTSSGEEPYSLSIILHESELADNLKILCSTPSPILQDKIIKGKFNNSRIDINQTNYRRLENKDDFSSYIENVENEKFVNNIVLKNIECIVENCKTASDKKNIGLIMFRNESLYLSSREAEEVYNLLIDQLSPGGFLVVGVKDSIPKSIENRLEREDNNERIYKKLKSNQSINYGF